MKNKPAPPDGAPPNNPFAALSGLRDQLPAGTAPNPPAAGPAQPARAQPGPARAVVRMERKGRAGKEVTVVEQLGLPAAALDPWLRALKSALGCGGVVEGETLVLQGDHRPRVKELLEARGVRRITIA